MSDHNRTLALRWFEEVWNQRRDATIDELLAPHARGHMEGAENQSPEQFKAARAALLSAFPDIRLVVEETVAEGDHVVLRWRATGTHRGEGLGFAGTGTRVEFRGMTWQRFEGGMIVEGWDSWNQGALMATLQAAAAAASSSGAAAGG
jgi:predicted ester cyclase